MHTSKSPINKTVAIIGAGAAGLAAVSVLRRQFSVTAFESSEQVGGVWNYRSDPDGGPMYRYLRTNLPKESMAYPDWEWRDESNSSPRSFVSHEQVLAYLRSYCYGQGLEAHIRLGERVVSVRPASSAAGTAWQVETQLGGTQLFDAVVVANGHFEKPSAPKLPGWETFPTASSHSSRYRQPEDFQGMVVALLGASSSGQDIALELSRTAKHIYLCHRGPVLQSTLPENITQLGPIVELCPDGSVVSKQLPSDELSKVHVDHVMFCTGYDYDYPFLDQACVRTEPSHVPRLFMQVAHCDLPGLYFLGLCTLVVPFPQFHLQAKLVEALLDGRVKLPEDAGSLSDREAAEKLAAGVTPRHLHTLADSQWDYNDRLADLADCPRLPPVCRRLFNHVKIERQLRLVHYKDLVYRLIGQDAFQVFHDRSGRLVS